jgi:hypothetical protein
MLTLPSLLNEAVYVTFALFARKLILCGEIIAIAAMTSWRIDAQLGLPIWPQRRGGLAGLSDALAAAATLVVVLYVAFVRDFSELGASPSLSRYGSMCLGVTLCIWLVGCAIAAAFGRRSGAAELLVVGSITGVGIPLLDEAVRLSTRLVEPLGRAVRVDQSVWSYHGFAVVLTALVASIFVFRLRRALSAPAPVTPWDLFLFFALLALVQGALAFRGVSAVYILAVAAAAGFGAGWRLRLEYAGGEFRLRAYRHSLNPAQHWRRRADPEQRLPAFHATEKLI